MVRGSGPVELDLEVMSSQFICVNVPRIGSSGTSTIYAGSVNFDHAGTVVDGNLVNKGAARTQFFNGGLTLRGDLTVDGRWLADDASTTQNPTWDKMSDGKVTPAEYEAATAANGGLDGLLDVPVLAVVGGTGSKIS